MTCLGWGGVGMGWVSRSVRSPCSSCLGWGGGGVWDCVLVGVVDGVGMIRQQIRYLRAPTQSLGHMRIAARRCQTAAYTHLVRVGSENDISSIITDSFRDPGRGCCAYHSLKRIQTCMHAHIGMSPRLKNVPSSANAIHLDVLKRGSVRCLPAKNRIAASARQQGPCMANV